MNIATLTLCTRRKLNCIEINPKNYLETTAHKPHVKIRSIIHMKPGEL